MRTKIMLLSYLTLFVFTLAPWTGVDHRGKASTAQTVRLAGLRAPVRVVRDSNDIPHIFAGNDHDAIFMLGYVHAQDRFFQMDFQRHLASGTLAELVGSSVLNIDIQLRTLGLRRAAEETLAVLSPESQALLQAYSKGVNAYLSEESNPLPLEYEALELTKASIAPWSPLDSVAIGKLIAFSLSFDSFDLDLTLALAAY